MSLRIPAILAITLCASAVVHAHELADNRATLVLRDSNHVSITLFLDYPEALHRALAPGKDFAAFLLVYSAMKPEDLRAEITRAQILFQSATHFLQKSATGGPERELSIGNWNWPDARQVQSMIQQRVMQSMTGGHSHSEPVEVRADAVSVTPILSLSARFPEEFQNVLVVSYRPNQVWVGKNLPAAAIRF